MVSLHVENGHLPATCLDHRGMAVAHVDSVAHAVQVGLSVLIEEMLPKPPDDSQKAFGGSAEVGAQVLVPK